MNSVTIKLWHRKLDADGTDYQHHWETLDTDERKRAAAINKEFLHRRYVTTQGLLRSILAKTVNQPPEQLVIRRMEHGKPYLADYPELAFNLSHTGDTMVLAIGENCRLGVDIETCRTRANFPALVEKCFAEIEAAWWRTLPETEKIREFYRFWTRKEALVKADGRGIALGLSRCVINPENPATWLSVPASCEPASAWHVRDIDMGETICGALVADKAIAGVTLIAS